MVFGFEGKMTLLLLTRQVAYHKNGLLWDYDSFAL